MKKGKTVGITSAAVGAVVGAAAGVMLSNKKVREKVLDKLDTFSSNAADVLEGLNSQRKYAFAGTKGGKVKKKRK